MASSTAVDPAVEYNKRIVLASTIVVLIISNGSYLLRLWARKKSNQVFQWDDYIMGLALPFSYIPAVCMLYGLTVGLGEHVANVSKADLKKFNISLFILQRGNPPCLLCVKTSILLLYVRLFRTQTFKRVAFGVWIFTLCWAISAFMSNVFQCTPVSYFWNKAQPGHCIPNALITIGMTNGVLSFVGDLVILSLPIPMVWKLQIDKKRKIALIGMFLLGGFVCLTSILRFIALAKINVKDITFTQVDPGLWTYVELGVGITSGNLPLLRPIFGKFFRGGTQTGSSATYGNGSKPLSYPLSRVTVTGSRSDRGDDFPRDGFRRMQDKNALDVDVESMGESGSEIELNMKGHGKGSGSGNVKGGDWMGEGIQVKTDVDLRIEEVRQGIEREVQRQNTGGGIKTNVHSSFGR